MLVVHMGADAGHGTSFKPTVLAAVPGRELRWVGKLGPGGIVEGEHYFVLARNADGTTRPDHGETFSGAGRALVKLFDHGSLEKSHNGYDDFSQVFKQRAETVRDTR
jgi:hypothetical protein